MKKTLKAMKITKIQTLMKMQKRHPDLQEAKMLSKKTKNVKSSSRSRGRPTKKKSETIEISDDSTQDLSDSAGEEKKSKRATSRKNVEDEPKSSRKRQRKSTTTDSGDRTRGVGRSKPEPLSKRPSRNKQVKKYTEVDEDFSDAKSEEEEEEEEVEFEAEVKKETSGKRKREKNDEVLSSKKSKRGKASKEKSEDSEEVVELKDEESSTKGTDKAKGSKREDEDAEDIDSEEAMEIDEGDPGSPVEKKSDSKAPKDEIDKEDDDEEEEDEEEEEEELKTTKTDSGKKETEVSDAAKQESLKDAEAKEEKKSDLKDKRNESPLPKDELEDTQNSKASSQYSDDAEDSAEDSEDIASKESGIAVSKTEQSKSADTADAKSASNCLDTKPENTFPQKDTPESAINGENDKLEAVSVPPAVTDGPQSRDVPPKQNGSQEDDDTPKKTEGYPPLRRYVANPSITDSLQSSLKDKTFGVASYSLRGSESINKDKLLQELSKLQASVICLQDVSKALYHDVLESNMDMLGFKGIGSWQKEMQRTGLATFYKTSVFRLTKSTEMSLQKVLGQEMESSNLDDNSKETLRRSLTRCGSMLSIQLSTVLGDRHLVVGNVEIPSGNASLNTMQMSCVTQELIRISEELAKPVLLCSGLNMLENKIPYQLLRHGSLTESMLEELKSKTENPSEVAAFESVLKKASLRPSCKMSSCYATVLGKELLMLSTKVTSSSLVWFTPETLHTIGVLDITPEFVENVSDHPVSLKADVAFSV